MLQGGRIEEWIDGAALLCEDMPRTTVLHGAATIVRCMITCAVPFVSGFF